MFLRTVIRATLEGKKKERKEKKLARNVAKRLWTR